MRTLSVMALLTWAVLFTGCLAVNRESQLVGRYFWSANGVNFALEIHSDHTYSETATVIHGPTEAASGKWSLEDGHVSFESLLIPGELAGKNERISRGPSGLSAESHYGRPVMLILDPDRDLGFQRIEK
jgi:hypothetical protein